MKKYVLSMLAAFCLVFSIGNMHVEAKHFDYNEAYQILQGTWMDTVSGKEIIPVWKSKDGSECNIINGQGYTDSTGDSSIYFDSKGAVCKMLVTYYPDQDKYYGKMIMINTNTGREHVLYNCLVRE